MNKYKVPQGLTLQEQQTKKTMLYDLSVELNIDIPRSKQKEFDTLHKITLIAIADGLASKHPYSTTMRGTIYSILKRTIGSVTKGDFNVSNTTKKRVVFEKTCQSAGQIIEPCLSESTPIYFDKIDWSGDVEENYKKAGPVDVSCCVELFLSPGVYAARDIYEEHGFPIDDFKDPVYDDPEDIMNFCNNLSEDEDFAERWQNVMEGFEGFQDYWKRKRAIRRELSRGAVYF